eukprot:COSAG02_NODE_10613_length_1900_cov_2.996669_2_plen_170_part_00
MVGALAAHDGVLIALVFTMTVVGAYSTYTEYARKRVGRHAREHVHRHQSRTMPRKSGCPPQEALSVARAESVRRRSTYRRISPRRPAGVRARTAARVAECVRVVSRSGHARGPTSRQASRSRGSTQPECTQQQQRRQRRDQQRSARWLPAGCCSYRRGRAMVRVHVAKL